MNTIDLLDDAFERMQILHLALRECLSAPAWDRLDECIQTLEQQCTLMQQITREPEALQAALRGLDAVQRQGLRDKIAQVRQLHEINQELLYLGMERAEQMVSMNARLSSRSRYDRGGRWVLQSAPQLLTRG